MCVYMCVYVRVWLVFTSLSTCEVNWGELVFYAIFQPCLVIYGGQFPQLEEQIVHGSEPATFR